jgi:hypothetical protein
MNQTLPSLRTDFLPLVSFKFAYKLGHNRELSISEFRSLSGNAKAVINSGFIFSDYDIDFASLGAIVFKCLVNKTLPLVLPKKIGYVTLDKQKNQINKLKELGAKKILLQNKYPNAGHFKYVANWFIELEAKEELVYLQVTDHQDADNWTKLDMNLPVKDMKKGIINLKLARSMYNLLPQSAKKSKNICDPFSGLGRNAIAIMDLDLNFALSDNDPSCVDSANQNFDFAQELLHTQSKLVSNIVLDAQKLTNPFGTKFSIVTEGYLTEVLDDFTTERIADERLVEVKSFWQTTLKNWNKIDGLEAAVFCVPYYLVRALKIYLDPLELLEGTGFKLNTNPIFYDRAKTKIGHLVISIVRN